MLGFEEPSIYERSKCFFTHGRLQHIDPQQLPKDWEKKGKPWTAVLSHDFIRRVSACRVSLYSRQKLIITQVDVVLPQESWELVRDTLLRSAKTPEYCRVSVALSQVLEGEFFTEYIKIGMRIFLSPFRGVTGPVEENIVVNIY